MKFYRILAVFTGLMAMGMPLQARAGVIVYELYTAQGCPSCPEAENIFHEVIQKRPDVISLACHVTYFDRGRKDPLSAPFCDGRHTGYKASKILPKIYTPAIIVNGVNGLAGNNRDKVLTALSAGGLEYVQALKPAVKGGYLNLALPLTSLNMPADVWLFSYDDKRAVRSITKLLRWNGKKSAISFPVSSIRAAGYAVIIQNADQTNILAAGKTN